MNSPDVIAMPHNRHLLNMLSASFEALTADGLDRVVQGIRAGEYPLLNLFSRKESMMEQVQSILQGVRRCALLRDTPAPKPNRIKMKGF